MFQKFWGVDCKRVFSCFNSLTVWIVGVYFHVSGIVPDMHTPAMISWFPMYFPIKVRLYPHYRQFLVIWLLKAYLELYVF